MRQRANRLTYAAGAMGLTLFGFVVALGQASAEQAPQKKVQNNFAAPQAPMIAPEDPVVQQFEQQWGPQFRLLYRSELHFLRVVCQPARQQYERIAADGEAALKATMRMCAVNSIGPAGEALDPRLRLANYLAT